MARLLNRVRDSLYFNTHIVPHLPPLNFITLHYLYFIVTTLVCSIIFYCISTPAWSISYTDCLFLQISAMTEAGLNTYNLSEMNTVQQWILWMQIMAGSAIWVSISVLHVRRKAFERRFGDSISRAPTKSKEKEPVQSEDGSTKAEAAAESHGDVTKSDLPTSTQEDSPSGHITFAPAARGGGQPPADRDLRQRGRSNSIFSFSGVGAAPVGSSFYRPSTATTFVNLETARAVESTRSDDEFHPTAFLTKHVVGRNSQFHGLTEEEREILGGVEYRAIKLLSWVVPVYFVLWQLLGAIAIGAWMAVYALDIVAVNAVNPWWNGAFNAVSAFNNSGMSLLDANMVPFQTSTYPVLTMALLILAGNTGYPVFLRLILWTMLKLAPDTERWQEFKHSLKFILDHPRRIYTTLFPSRPTWWLVATLIFLNGCDWVFFELLNIGNPTIDAIPTGSRVLVGLFQAMAVRSGGFYIVPITSLAIGVQVLYVIMMYISVYPVAITTRSSNVYEERSLGIYADASDDHPLPDEEKSDDNGAVGKLRRRVTGRLTGKPSGETRSYFVRQQMRGQLEHDFSWLVVAVFIISCVEVSNFNSDPITYSIFNIVFEVVSGYGCVGISTGLPNQAYSFSGGWRTVSKLILCAVMLRGRHRGLPVAVDKAVMLPRDLHGSEEEDHELAASRARASLSTRDKIL